jgi:uncharacterized metal-binding protein
MTEADKFIIFLCSSAINKGESKLSYRIASYIAQTGIASIGSIEKLATQHAASFEDQRRLIFLNDCRSGCVNVLTQGFGSDRFLFIDLYPHIHTETFNIAAYVHGELIPQVQKKWSIALPEFSAS